MTTKLTPEGQAVFIEIARQNITRSAFPCLNMDAIAKAAIEASEEVKDLRARLDQAELYLTLIRGAREDYNAGHIEAEDVMETINDPTHT